MIEATGEVCCLSLFVRVAGGEGCCIVCDSDSENACLCGSATK